MTAFELITIVAVGSFLGNLSVIAFQIFLAIGIAKYKDFLIRQELAKMLNPGDPKSRLTVVKEDK
jgi:hypothetical protein